MHINCITQYACRILMLTPVFSPGVMAAAGGMNEEQLQQMMEQMQAMQACIAKIDKADMERLDARVEAVQMEIDALCTAGRRDQAQERTIARGREMMDSKEVEEMIKCGEMAQQMIEQMDFLNQESKDELQNLHVCDNRE